MIIAVAFQSCNIFAQHNLHHGQIIQNKYGDKEAMSNKEDA